MSKILKLIEEKIKVALKRTYVNDVTVKKEFENFDETISVKDLYEKYAHFFGESKLAQHLKEKCKDDFCYWGYLSNEETYKTIADIYLEIINLESENNLIDGKKYIHTKNEADYYRNKYNKINEKINEEIQGLLKYKPSGYKSKIELLEYLLKNEE